MVNWRTSKGVVLTAGSPEIHPLEVRRWTDTWKPIILRFCSFNFGGCTSTIGGGISNVFGHFRPDPWGNDSFWRAYCSNGLVQPPTNLKDSLGSLHRKPLFPPGSKNYVSEMHWSMPFGDLGWRKIVCCSGAEIGNIPSTWYQQISQKIYHINIDAKTL